MDDGSTDQSAQVAEACGATVLTMDRTIGVGAALRLGYRYAVEHGFDVAVVMAGNNKDAPEEIPRLLAPLVDDGADFVQGSRFLSADRNFGAMPFYRRVATRVHPWRVGQNADNWLLYHSSENVFRTRFAISRSSEWDHRPVRIAQCLERQCRSDSVAKRIRVQGITDVVSFAPRSIELAWMKALPDRFEPLDGDEQWGAFLASCAVTANYSDSRVQQNSLRSPSSLNVRAAVHMLRKRSITAATPVPRR